jgi:hypothetical protein
LVRYSQPSVSAALCAIALTSALGCVRTPPESALGTTACPATAPSTARPFEPSQALELAGEFRLTLVSQWLDEAGRVAQGRLMLWPTDSLRRYHEPRFLTLYDSTPTPSGGVLLRATRVNMDSIVRWERSGDNGPLFGALEMDLDSVSAPAEDYLASRNPNQPGARLVGRDIRLTPPPLGVMQNDGSSTTLTIHATDTRGFYGRWTTDFGFGRISRNGRIVPNPSGFFCAHRSVEEPPQN